MRLAWAMVAVVVVFGAPAAQAQMDSREAIQLHNEILDMRRDLQALRQQGGNASALPRVTRPQSGDDSGGLTAQLLDRVATLEEQVRALRGEVDRLGNQQQRQGEELNKQIADLSFTLQNSGGQNSGGQNSGGQSSGRRQAASPVSQASDVAPPPGLVPRTPELAMQEGNAALARRDYPAAEAAAREVIAKRGPRQADGQFLLAQAELGQRNFQQAAPDFYDAYNRARTGARAPDALLGVANALVGVGDKPAACEALAKLRTEFPQPRADVREGEAATRQRAGCR